MMHIATILELEKLARSLDANGENTESTLALMAGSVAKMFSVRAEEVAVLGISLKWKHLYFLVPESLKKVGFIPLSNKFALAARTVRDKRPEIVNNFSAIRHASVFEGVKSPEIDGQPIQKILSAPIFSGETVIGVIQISRKGSNTKTAGPDFSAEDLKKVVGLSASLGIFLKQRAAE
jgi:hypothetical protein